MKRWCSGAAVMCAAAAVWLVAPVDARRAVATWDGGGAGPQWQTAANWAGDTAPSPGDDLVFPDGALQPANLNDFPGGTPFNSITFSGASGGYSLGGNGITLLGGISAANTGGINTISLSFAVEGPHDIGVTASGGTLLLSGVISGLGDLIKSGAGHLRLSGMNTYGGTTAVNGGRLTTENAAALGAGNGAPETGTTVADGAMLVVGNFTIANEAFAVFGAGQSGNGVLRAGGLLSTLGGPVALGDASVAMNVLGGERLTFAGVVSGAGRFGLGNDGVFILQNPGNSFSGPITWGATGVASSVLRLGASHVIPNAIGLDIPAAGTLDVNGFSETIASLAGAGAVQLPGASALTVSQTANTTFSGTLSGAGSITKSGPGTLTLTGANTHSGTTAVSAGTLLVNGSQTTSAVSVSGGVFGGTGSTGALTATGGTVAPGVSPGILNVGATSFNDSTIFAVELNGTTVGSQYDQLNVTGAVSLGSAVLTVVPGFAATLGTSFVIINNDGADPVTGTFAGLAESGVVPAGSQSFSISYVGGTGNDVVLTAVAPVPTVGVFGGIVLFLLLATVAFWRLRRTPQDGLAA